MRTTCLVTLLLALAFLAEPVATDRSMSLEPSQDGREDENGEQQKGSAEHEEDRADAQVPNDDPQSIEDAAFAGGRISIRIKDPGAYLRIHKGNLGFIIRAADFNGKKPTFAKRHFQLAIDEYPGPVILTGSHFEITNIGAQGEDLVGKYLRVLRRPARPDLLAAQVRRGMLGVVTAFTGSHEKHGIMEDTFTVQMLTEPRLKPLSKPVMLLRHEFEVVVKPEFAGVIGAPKDIIPIGKEVQVHSPDKKRWPPEMLSMLQDEHGVVQGVTGNDVFPFLYVVHLTLYQKDVELLPAEITIWKEPTPEHAKFVIPPKQRADCNYTELAKFEAKAEGHLVAIKGQMETDLTPKVETAVNKHNAYVSRLWENSLGLEDFNDNVDKFRAKSAEGDEDEHAVVTEAIKKGDKVVKDMVDQSSRWKTFSDQRNAAIGEAQKEEAMREQIRLQKQEAESGVGGIASSRDASSIETGSSEASGSDVSSY